MYMHCYISSIVLSPTDKVMHKIDTITAAV